VEWRNQVGKSCTKHPVKEPLTDPQMEEKAGYCKIIEIKILYFLPSNTNVPPFLFMKTNII